MNEEVMEFYPIRLKSHPNWCIGIQHGKAQRGVNICLQKYTGADHQMWCLDYFGCIRTRLDVNYVMDVHGSRFSRGTNVWLYDFNGTDAQQWRYDGAAFLRPNRHGNVSLDLDHFVRKEGQNIHMWDNNNTDAQRWILDKSSKVLGSRRAAASMAKKRKNASAAKKQAEAAKSKQYADMDTIDKLFQFLPKNRDYRHYQVEFKSEGISWRMLQRGLTNETYRELGVHSNLHRRKIEDGVEELAEHLKNLGLNH